jgi:hypothetical protein
VNSIPPGETEQQFFGLRVTWDRCYDFLKNFAKNFGEKMAFLLKTKVNYAKF